MNTLKQKVTEAAERAEVLAQQYQGLGLMNTPADYKERIESQARLRIVHDKYWVAKTEYDKAFEAWAKAGFPE